MLSKEDCATLDGIAFLTEGLAYRSFFLMQTYGVRVPADIAVVVIDGSRLCDETTPPLERIADELTRRLMAAIDGAPPFRLVHIPPSLTKRKST